MVLGISQSIIQDVKTSPKSVDKKTGSGTDFVFPQETKKCFFDLSLTKSKDPKNINLSSKMKSYIISEEGGENHMNKDGMYVVYRGKADKKADEIKNENEPLLTVAHGHTGRGKITVGHRDLKEGDVISQYQAQKLLDDDIDAIKKQLTDRGGCKLEKKLTQNQTDAVLSYAMNAGVEKLCESDEKRDIPESMVSCLNKGEFGKAQAKFNIITAGGQLQAGLAKRRIVEMVIFGNGKILPEAAETFKNNKNGLSGYKKLWHIHKINKALKNYGIDDNDRKKIISHLIY